MQASIDAIRARATLGECTAALERVWPRHQACPRFDTGIYAEERHRDYAWAQVQAEVTAHARR